MKKAISLLAIVLCLTVGVRAAVVDTITIDSKYLATPAKAVVVQPEAAQYSAQVFPTVYLLHGYSGDYSNWINKCPELKHISDLYGMIIVMPDGRDSWYWNWPNDPGMQMEAFFGVDLVPYIDGNYPTRREPSQRAITGLSMGGHGSLYLAIRHGDIWGNAGTMSGGVDIRPFPKSWKMSKALGPKAENEQSWNEHTVMGLLDQLQDGQLNITIDCGVDDFFAEVNRNLHNALLEKGVKHDYTERPGKHNWTYWCNSVLYHMLFFNEAFQK